MEKFINGMAKSYANQEDTFSIPASELTSISLGFQPLGMASKKSENGALVAIAAYFEPAICLAGVKLNENRLDFKIHWIRSVNHGIHSVRIFPDTLFYGEVNRTQTVNFGSNGTLWVSRNGDKAFFILSPPKNPEASPHIPEGKWTLIDKVTLSCPGMIHSALLTEEKIIVIESGLNLNNWYLGNYQYNGQLIDKRRIPTFMYGIAGLDDDLIIITDLRSRKKYGIYNISGLMIPEIFGNGICFLCDESALISIFGQSHHFPLNGQPGRLAYLPKKYLCV
ncbi:MAG: hypothetical protein ABH830_03030 [Patescibacteria group bacterium]